MALWGPSWLLAQVAQPAAPPSAVPDLSREVQTVAASSPRPEECGAVSKRLSTIWDQVRAPLFSNYCAALARGYARLETSPADALRDATAALRALPRRAAPLLLRGRAHFRLGQTAGAWKDFSEAYRRDPRVFAAPAGLSEAALTAALTGNKAFAVDAYRRLVSRAGLFQSELMRHRSYIEAAAWIMSADTAQVGEAVGYLAEARRRGAPPSLSPFVVGALAIALDRQGRSEEALGVAAEAEGPWALLKLTPEGDEALDPEDSAELQALGMAGVATATAASESDSMPDSKLGWRTGPILPPGEIHAWIAFLAEKEDPALARRHYRAFLAEAPDSVWFAHAQARLSALQTKRGKRR